MPVEVTFYTRRNCSLCDKAKAAIRESGAVISLREVDIDDDPELRRRYTDDVPVIEIAGVDAFRHRVDPQAFRDYIRGMRKDSSL
ncbi:MAG TPA: glutaredoxin family protein, partial [Thermoanaerobaculia bacterium]